MCQLIRIHIKAIREEPILIIQRTKKKKELQKLNYVIKDMNFNISKIDNSKLDPLNKRSSICDAIQIRKISWG